MRRAWLEAQPRWRLERDPHPERMLPDIIRAEPGSLSRIRLLAGCLRGCRISLMWFDLSRPRPYRPHVIFMHPDQYRMMQDSLKLQRGWKP